MENVEQIKWSEVRINHRGYPEEFFIIADMSSAGLEFYERSSWNTRWYSIPSSEELVSKAVAQLSK